MTVSDPGTPRSVSAAPPLAATSPHGRLAGMVLEVALIDVQEGREDEFAAAYAKARSLVATTPGCRSVRMTRGVETPTRFVLLVEWDSVEAHIENFRATDRFAEWRGLIGPYFDGAPRVEHFADLAD
jgi:heme-degrading monooxygenase HmoA